MTAALAGDPGRLHACVLLPRFIAMDLRLARRRLARRLGLSELKALTPDSHLPPDSALARQATELAREMSDASLLNHCLRTFHFGAILGARDGLAFDRELFYIAAILHDLGLTPPFADAPGSFEYVGARAAHGFCLKQGLDARKAALVHDAIALHSAVGIAHRQAPEVALVHFGAGADVIGIRLDEVPPDALADVLERYPRAGFKAVFSALLAEQVLRKPDSHIAGHLGLGFAGKIAATPFDE